MDPDRWAKMELLIEQALELPPEERESFLREECGSDDELRFDIELLLRNSDSAFTFIRDFTENIISPSLKEVIEDRQQNSGTSEPTFIDKPVAHYEIMEKLGSGGMGVVYKAWDTRLERTVALKFLSPRTRHREEFKKRLSREARAAGSLNHPNITTVYEIGEKDGQAFIAMEYIDGKGLDEKISHGPLLIREVLDIAIQVAEGLQAAHEKGIVHRDLKSNNVMVTEKGQVKVMDFSLAKLEDISFETKEGRTMGTFPYMSPEQARGIKIDQRTDIWSLGVVMYEMTVGLRPFRANNEHTIIYQILNEKAEPVKNHRSNVPMELERIIGKAMQKDRNSRYQNLNDMVADIRLLLTQIESENGEGTIEKTKIRGMNNFLSGVRNVFSVFTDIIRSATLFFGKLLKR